LITNSTESVRRPFQCTIVEAIIATMASPGVFEPVLIKYGAQKELIYGPGVGYNNPTDAVLLLVQNSTGIDEVACILNIGSGAGAGGLTYVHEGTHTGAIENNFPRNVITRCQEIIQDAENSASLVEEQMLSLQMPGRYFRLNIPNNVGHNDWRNADFLREVTSSYLSQENVANKANMLVDRLFEPLGRDGKIPVSTGGLEGVSRTLESMSPVQPLERPVAIPKLAEFFS
jgi:hypothetical protein